MEIRTLTVIGVTALFASLSGTRHVSAAQDDNTNIFAAKLLGDNEVPPINTAATGTFTMNTGVSPITFSLTFANLSTSTVLFSHLHFAPSKVAGGVMIFLCGGGGQPACPQATSGTITGTITTTNVVALPAQGIAAGDLASALEAVREGNAYCNLHTMNFPGGEMRGQVGPGRSDQ